ncbi:hypothetical protein GYMLUDRAFT_251468 [Collybiopsis luxurians FD-317 M1]|uniref:Uncharacterized protein n=1 Tax=Collybiopsis luxurians FD-317 M1 TaxID=944289 RepID=A0A0D0BR45_9AGAR|nr:hypothetical protein GYMLUDRAFT_251468 [Collybiopsis luxurians FD-317 M1]
MKRLGESSVAQVIVLDGSIYFLTMLITGVFTTTASLYGLFAESADSSYITIIIPFFDNLPNILISRLVLNLHAFTLFEEENRAAQVSRERQISGLQFATDSFLGNIGAPLDGGVMEEEEDIEEFGEN